MTGQSKPVAGERLFAFPATHAGEQAVDTLKALQEERLSLAAKIKSLADTQDKWTAEDRQAWDKLNADYDATMAKITAENERVDAAAKVNARLAEINGYQPNNPRIGRDGGRIEDRRASGPSDQAMALHGWLLSASTDLRNQITDNHRAAAQRLGINLADNSFQIQLLDSQEFRDFQADHPYRNGHREGAVRNAMKSGDPASGGTTIGSVLLTTLERAMLDYSGVLQVADVMTTTTGEPIDFITADDTANTGSRVGESADAGTATDPTFGRSRLTSFTFTSGLLYVSRSLLRDSVLNLEQQLGQMLGERLGRKQNTDYTTGGGGGNAPQGIVTGSTLGVTAASATATTWDEIIDLEHSIDPSRRSLPSVGYMMHDSILKAYRKLKDGNGQPIWQAGWNAGAPDTLNKRPYWINQAMASAMASGAKTLLFGQLNMMKVRRVGGIIIQRLVERRAEFNQDVFIAYASGDSAVLDPGDHPIKYLVH